MELLIPKATLLFGSINASRANPTDNFRLVGQIETGQVFEQTILVSDDDGQLLRVRRVKVRLKQPTRDGD